MLRAAAGAVMAAAAGQNGSVRYVIVGAGAVGGTIGALLHQHGFQVTLVARGAHLSAIQRHGLCLARPDGEQVHRLPAVAGPDGLVLEPDTVLVLTTKTQHSLAALETWADVPVRGGGVAGDRLPVVCAQNGVASERFALRWFARVYGVCVWLPATFLEAGVVAAEGYPYPGMLHLGRFPAGQDDTARSLAEDLSASGFATRLPADVMRWKYGKLLGNLSNGLHALFGGREEEIERRLRAEGTAVLAAAGIPHTSREEEAAVRGDRVQIRSVAGRPRGGSSTWQSLARGAGSAEVDYLNGEIVLLGREHGVATPANLAVQQAVRRAVRTGTPAGQFPVEEFQALLAAAGTG